MRPEGDRRLLAQAAAERDGQVVGPLVDAEVAEEVGGVLLPVVAAVQAGDVLEVLPDRQVLVEGRVVGDVADTAARAAERAGVVAAELDDARRSGSSRPAAIRRNVVLPEPLWPMSTTASPGSTVRSSGARAGRSP